MIIPVDNLSQQALYGVIESFILREGTDYGEIEVSLDEKIAQVHQQLVLGNLVLVFSELHQTVNIMSTEQFNNQPYD
ncbi:MAG: YheU family protein [Alteromonadaceae bacterium]|nr:YheU family protein [Alteromonadaceae bacterium]